MKSLIDSLSLATQLLGSHLSVATLTAHTIRTENMGIDFQSLIEYLKSEGFENDLMLRDLADIPQLAMPVVVILKNEEAAVITAITGRGKAREYRLQQFDGISQVVTYEQLNECYLGYCWFIKPRVSIDARSELPEYEMPKAWFFKVIWRFRKYYYQVIISTFMINFLALVSSLYVMNVYDRVIPNKSYDTLWVLSIGVIIAILFEFIAKLIRGHLTDIAGKKADLIISTALFRRVMSVNLKDRPASAGSYASNLREYESVRDFMTSASLLNSNDDGVSTNSPVSEGDNIVTTVKLTNANGVDGLEVARNGTGDKPATAADFDDTATTYTAYDASGAVVANGVTVVGGKLNVAAGVTKFTISTPVKADEATEGNETVTYTVGGVDGNEAIIIDTSQEPATSPEDPPVSVDNSEGDGVVTSTPVDEGGEIVTTVKLHNFGGGELDIARIGTGGNPASDADFDDANTTYQAYIDGDVPLRPGTGVTFENGKLKIADGITKFTITTTVKEDKLTEGAETVKYIVGGVSGNEATITDTSTEKNSPVVPVPQLGGLPLVLENLGNNTISGSGKPGSTFTIGNGTSLGTANVTVGADGTWQATNPLISQLDDKTAGAQDNILLITPENSDHRVKFYMFDKPDTGASLHNGMFDFRDNPAGTYHNDGTGESEKFEMGGRKWGAITSFENPNGQSVAVFVDGNLSARGSEVQGRGFIAKFTDYDDVLNVHKMENNTGIATQDKNTGIFMLGGNDIYMVDTIAFNDPFVGNTNVNTMIDMGEGNDFVGIRYKLINAQHACINGGAGSDTLVIGYQQDGRVAIDSELNLNPDRIAGFEHVVINKGVGPVTLNISTEDVLEGNTRYIDGDSNVTVKLNGFATNNLTETFAHQDFYGNTYEVTYHKYSFGESVLYLETSITNIVVI